MKPDRLNALTDGVVAVVITLMVLELRAPHGHTFNAVRPWLPLLGVYVLSFVNIGIYWNNHHHMMQRARAIDGWVLWANLALLFFLSLTPTVIRWIDEQGMKALPVGSYGLIMVAAGLSYTLLEYTLEFAEGAQSVLKTVLGSRTKEWASLTGYLAGIGLAFISPILSLAIYVLVTAGWFIPDRRFERRVTKVP